MSIRSTVTFVFFILTRLIWLCPFRERQYWLRILQMRCQYRKIRCPRTFPCAPCIQVSPLHTAHPRLRWWDTHTPVYYVRLTLRWSLFRLEPSVSKQYGHQTGRVNHINMSWRDTWTAASSSFKRLLAQDVVSQNARPPRPAQYLPSLSLLHQWLTHPQC